MNSCEEKEKVTGALIKETQDDDGEMRTWRDDDDDDDDNNDGDGEGK